MATEQKVSSVTATETKFTSSLPEAKNSVGHGCWRSGDATLYDVRGPTYMEDDKKIPSLPSLCVLAGVDVLTDDKKVGDVAKIPGTTIYEARLSGDDSFIIAMNLQLPGPPHYSVVSYLSVPKEMEGASEGLKNLLKQFSEGSDEFRNNRFKLIPRLIDGPWMVRKTFGGYKSAPFLIGTKLPTVHFKSENHVEICFDVAVNTVAAQITKLALGYAKTLALDLAIVIQGETPEELPERILSVVHLANIDVTKARSVKGLNTLSS